MCEPVTIMAAVSAVTAGVSMYGQRQSAKAQVAATNQQNKIQAEEISRKAGQEMTELARDARRERGTARVLAGEAGINLGSGSFLAQMQSSAMSQYSDMGLVIQNEKAQQAARSAQTSSIFSNINMPSWGEIALGTGAAGYQGYVAGKATYDKGAASAGGK